MKLEKRPVKGRRGRIKKRKPQNAWDMKARVGTFCREGDQPVGGEVRVDE